jgi:hypothetical protein
LFVKSRRKRRKKERKRKKKKEKLESALEEIKSTRKFTSKGIFHLLFDKLITAQAKSISSRQNDLIIRFSQDLSPAQLNTLNTREPENCHISDVLRLEHDIHHDVS